jgi:hypothetical protein
VLGFVEERRKSAILVSLSDSAISSAVFPSLSFALTSAPASTYAKIYINPTKL